jgi:hypothetical protein
MVVDADMASLTDRRDAGDRRTRTVSHEGSPGNDGLRKSKPRKLGLVILSTEFTFRRRFLGGTHILPPVLRERVVHVSRNIPIGPSFSGGGQGSTNSCPAGRTVRTGQGAFRTTFSATLPIKTCARPDRP